MTHPLYTPKPPPRRYRKMIVQDPKTKQFAGYLNGELVCYTNTRLQAEAALNQLVYELLSTPTA